MCEKEKFYQFEGELRPSRSRYKRDFNGMGDAIFFGGSTLGRVAGAGAGCACAQRLAINDADGTLTSLPLTGARAVPTFIWTVQGASVHLTMTSRLPRSLINTINSAPRAFEAYKRLFPLHRTNTWIMWDTRLFFYNFHFMSRRKHSSGRCRWWHYYLILVTFLKGIIRGRFYCFASVPACFAFYI